MDPQIHVVLPDFTYGQSLDRVVSYEFSSQLSDVGGGILVYPRSGAGSEFLFQKAYVVIKDSSGVPGINAIFMVDTWSEDLIKEGVGVQTRTWHLVGVAARLGECEIGPAPGSPLALPRQFGTLGTPGRELSQWLTEAHDRGTLLEIDRDFGPDHDSNGDDWAETNIDPKVVCGTTPLDRLRALEQAGFIEWYMQGFTLRVFNPGGAGVDRTVDPDKLFLERGYHLLDGPIRNVVTQLATVVTVYGDADRFVTVTDDDAIADPTIGRREASYNARGVLRPGTLTKIGQAYLRANNGVRRNQTYAVAQGTTSDKDIGVACDIADKVFITDGGVATAPHPQRIRGAVRAYSEANGYTAVIDVSNALQERDIRIWQRINQWQAATDGLDGGATPNRDSMPPTAPEWRATSFFNSSLVDPPAGQGGARRAQAVVRLQTVTEDADGVDCFDLAGYRIYWRYSTDAAFGSKEVKIGDDGFDPDDVTITLQDLTPGATVYAYPTAFDANGNESAPGELKTKILDGSTGRFLVTDGVGGVIMDTLGEALRVFQKFEIRSADATDVGLAFDTDHGFRAWDPLGTLTFKVDVSTGDTEIHGNLHVDGTTTIENDTTINDTTVINGTLTVNADVTFTADFTVSGVTHLGGTLTLDADLDAAGHEITGGKFSTVAGGITIDSDTITFAAGTTLAMSGGVLGFSTGVNIGGQVQASGASIGGTFAHTGTAFGVLNTTPRGAYPIVGIATDLPTVIALANDLRSLVQGFGFA